ncbi:secreted RxLR effector protein 161-like [Nicotiana tabacum]|uniref:Secreted RxLR effector protein 161-like n=1 Tax=Nicotiana tabacum TaxID=4097 RepID=A0AC58RPE1_TOBAC
MELNQKLTTVEYDMSFREGNATTDEVLRDPSAYQRQVGKLLYLTMTRSDILFIVQVLSQFMHCPRTSHMETTSRVVRYMKQAPGLGLLMHIDDSKSLIAYCHSDWGPCVKTRRSVTGYLVKFRNALVSWKSKKQSIVSRSSTEAEFRSIASCSAEITWLIELYAELGVKVSLLVKPVKKPYEGVLKTEYVHTEDQLADLVTKSLGRAQHEYLLNQLGLKNVYQPSA